jgi:hypothetical protein
MVADLVLWHRNSVMYSDRPRQLPAGSGSEALEKLGKLAPGRGVPIGLGAALPNSARLSPEDWTAERI